MIDFKKLNRIAQDLGIEVKRANHIGSNLKYIDENGYETDWDAHKELGIKKSRIKQAENFKNGRYNFSNLPYNIVITNKSTINYLTHSKKIPVSNDKNNERFGERQCIISL